MTPRVKKFAVPLVLAALAGLLCMIGLVAQHPAESPQVAMSAATQTPAPEAVPQERVLDLPQDGQAYFVSIFVNKDWRRRRADRHLIACWQSIPELSSIRAQTHFSIFVDGDKSYDERMKLLITKPRLPEILIQTAAGEVVYRESGETLPQSTAEWANTCGKIFGGRAVLPWNRDKGVCPKPGPAPEPAPGPVINTAVTIPDRVTPPPAKEEKFPWLLLAAIVGLAGVTAFVVQFRREASE